MDPLNNNNLNADHAILMNAENSLTKTMQNIDQTTAHPLQDVPLTTHENMSEMQSEPQQRVQTKENWVKFDDDANEMSGSGSGSGSGSKENNFNGNNNNNNNDPNSSYDQADSSSIATTLPANRLLSSKAAAATPSPVTALLPPPRPQQPSARPRTPSSEHANKSAASPSALQREPVTISPLNASPTPVQRSIVSSGSATATAAAAAAPAAPDVAPAVLTTESTHVNLNASGKAQHHHHQQQQQQQQQRQQHHSSLPQHQQQQKKKTSAFTGNATVVGVGSSNSTSHQYSQQPLQSHHTQLPLTQHHSNSNNNNGTTTSIPTATTNNAMHHKSHHNQQHHHQHHPTPNTSTSATTLPVEAATTSSSSSAAVTSGPPAMRTIELSTGRIREGFANGDVIVTLLPANTKWPWITPAIFRPELVPEELMAQGLTLTVEEYVQAMETLVNDFRFTVYNICYKRILVCWIFFAFTVLLTLLFSGLQGVALFSLGVGWLFLNAAAIFVCMWVKLRLARGLEKCLARVNRQLMKHKILLILDDRGRISCHKVNLCFLYFDATQCVNFLNDFLEQTEQNGGEAIKAGWESKLDIDLNDIVIQGSTPVRVSRKQAVAQELYLSYLQRWGKDFLRRRLDWTVQEAGVHETPRHLQSSICPCQYEEEILRNKIKLHLRRRQCCGLDCIGCWL